HARPKPEPEEKALLVQPIGPERLAVLVGKPSCLHRLQPPGSAPEVGGAERPGSLPVEPDRPRPERERFPTGPVERVVARVPTWHRVARDLVLLAPRGSEHLPHRVDHLPPRRVVGQREPPLPEATAEH